MIVIDSSALVAILRQEPPAQALLRRMVAEPVDDRLLSTANYVETCAVLAGRYETPDEGVEALDRFVAEARIALVPVDAALAKLALRARIEFGRGFGTRAKLNFGDSFAYALAKSRNAPLLFVGDDFAATDIVSAL